MPPSAALPAIVRPAETAAGLLVEAKGLASRSERDALECGRKLLRAKECCIRESRGWLDELAKTDFPRSSAWRYMHLAEEADRPPPDPLASQLRHDGPIAEDKSDPDPGDADAPTPVRRRERDDAPTDDPRELARREALTHIDGLGRALTRLDLRDQLAADLHRMRGLVERSKP